MDKPNVETQAMPWLKLHFPRVNSRHDWVAKESRSCMFLHYSHYTILFPTHGLTHHWKPVGFHSFEYLGGHTATSYEHFRMRLFGTSKVCPLELQLPRVRGKPSRRLPGSPPFWSENSRPGQHTKNAMLSMGKPLFLMGKPNITMERSTMLSMGKEKLFRLGHAINSKLLNYQRVSLMSMDWHDINRYTDYIK